jgi:phosphoglucosamine mutase
MDAASVFSLGQAVTRFFRKPGELFRAVVGKDTRISGDMLESALQAGITSMGGHAFQLGVLPTPGVAFMTKGMRFGAGIMISASHNPYRDNGIKVFSGRGFKLAEEEEEAIEDLVLGGGLPAAVSPPEAMGRNHRIEDAPGRYIVRLKGAFPRHLSMEGMKIAMDTANGATSRIAPEVFSELGAAVRAIHNRPDGININEGCGSEDTRDLQAEVGRMGAQIGLAFDGDGDRLIAVDEDGRRLTGDQILLIGARMLRDSGALKKDLLVSTVMSNLGLRVACARYGLRHHASQVGDRYVLQDMQRLGAVIGGEASGHTIYLDHHTTGDGILSAIQLIAAMLESGRPLSELAALMEIYPQELINVEVRSKPDISSLPQVMEAIGQVEEELGEEGRVLVRYSGTQPICRVMVEGPGRDITRRHCEEIAAAVKIAIGQEKE